MTSNLKLTDFPTQHSFKCERQNYTGVDDVADTVKKTLRSKTGEIIISRNVFMRPRGSARLFCDVTSGFRVLRCCLGKQQCRGFPFAFTPKAVRAREASAESGRDSFVRLSENREKSHEKKLKTEGEVEKCLFLCFI